MSDQGPASPEAQETIAEFVRLMTLDLVGPDVFVGATPREVWPRLYGGHVLGQCISAAVRTCDDDRVPHALHSFFLRGGDPREPVALRVERLRDGRTFSTRRVSASQAGREILTATISFHTPQVGPGYAAAPPAVVGPEVLVSEGEIRREEAEALGLDLGHLTMRGLPIEVRPVTPWRFSELKPEPPVANYWVRAVAPLPHDRTLRTCLLTYASDMLLLLTALRPHAIHYAVTPMDSGSLDHSLWLHAPAPTDDWMLWATESPWSGAGRGLARGAFFDRSGRMIANAVQEGLVRPH